LVSAFSSVIIEGEGYPEVIPCDILKVGIAQNTKKARLLKIGVIVEILDAIVI